MLYISVLYILDYAKNNLLYCRWDSRNSIFITHHPGLYFFTFSVKADAKKADNFKYEP